MKDKKIGMADFETTLQEPVRVWLSGIKDIDDCNMDIRSNSFKYFSNFKDWFYYVLENYKQVFFHNEKFDGSFILNELNKMRYTCYDPNVKIRGKRTKRPKNKRIYNIDIDLMGQVYEIKVSDEFNNTVRFNDSLKLFQFSVKDLGKSMDIDKLNINENSDYSNYTINEQSVSYLHHDIEIPRRMLYALRNEGYTKKTIASCSLESYKKLIGKDNFNTWFPNAESRKDYKELLHRYCNQAYDGGICYVYGEKEKTCNYGVVLDVNSLYPSMCLQRPLPYGKPITDDLEDIEDYNNYIQYNNWRPIENTLSILEVYIKYGHVKKDYPPCIRAKECNDLEGYTSGLYNNSNILSPEEKWLSTIYEYHAIITEVDYNLLLKCYDNVDVKIISYMRFKSQQSMFDRYFKYWGDKKVQHGKENNQVLRTIDKMFMNSLTGKFGTNIDANYKIPYFEDDTLKFTTNTVLYNTFEEKASIYVPVIAFITAWGRHTLVNTVNKIGTDYFLYADTDSIHLRADRKLCNIIKRMEKTKDDKELVEYFINKGVKCDYNLLGQWAIEGVINKGKYVRPKTYIENIIAQPDKRKYNINKLDVKACGMNSGIKKHCTFDNFKTNTCWCTIKDKEKYLKKGLDVVVIPEKDAKLTPKQVKGGCLLTPTGFTINRINRGK